VLAPTSISDCVRTTQWAINLAERLQTATIVLSDQAMGQAQAIVDPPPMEAVTATRLLAKTGDAPYHRYQLLADGLSPMANPGVPGTTYTAEGLEHNEQGTPTSQAEDHRRQLDKRLHKLQGHDYGEAWALRVGEGSLAVITWGSVTGAVSEGLSRARASGVQARLLAIRVLAPVQRRRLMQALAGVETVLVVEQTHSGQFLDYLRATGVLPTRVVSLCRPGPLPIAPGEVTDALLELALERTAAASEMEY
jgi:2-oxoglutarate ferredoxin oxidoreductase subunit alpha